MKNIVTTFPDIIVQENDLEEKFQEELFNFIEKSDEIYQFKAIGWYILGEFWVRLHFSTKIYASRLKTQTIDSIDEEIKDQLSENWNQNKFLSELKLVQKDGVDKNEIDIMTSFFLNKKEANASIQLKLIEFQNSVEGEGILFKKRLDFTKPYFKNCKI